MTRRPRKVIALIAMLAVALQAPVFAAVAAVGGGDCITTTQGSLPATSGNSGCPCCPDGAMTGSCCLGVCSAASAISTSQLLFASARPQAPADLEPSVFFTRSDVPLIRPPIP